MNKDTTQTEKRTCEVCGGPLRSHSKTGVCRRNVECIAEASRRSARQYYARNAEKCRGVKRQQRKQNQKKMRDYDLGRYWADPETMREKARESRNRNLGKVRARDRDRSRRLYATSEGREKVLYDQTLYRRRKGVRPQPLLVGQNHYAWAGGRFCICDVCGKPLGWRKPSQIHPNGTFCREHIPLSHGSSWSRERLLLRNGRLCFCDYCGKPLGWRSASMIRPNGTYCKEHFQKWRQHNDMDKERLA